MAEKNYKELYEKSLEKNRNLKKQVSNLKEKIEELQAERFYCDVEPLKGELFGKSLSIVQIEGQTYAKVELWTTESHYQGHLIGTKQPETETVFLRCDNPKRPVPYWIEDMDLNFVIKHENNARFVLNPEEGQPLHLLIHGDVRAWEGWNEDLVSELQIEHDHYYLKKCSADAARYVPRTGVD